MRQLANWIIRGAEFLAGMAMLAMFATFILQVTIRYTARLDWVAEAMPFLDPMRYGWTLEFCLALWVWIVFFGNATIVRDRDHVTFDILYNAVRPNTRKVFAIVAALAIAISFLLSVAPTWDKFHILRLKQTATLKQLLGDWVRMRDVYSIYIFFLIVVGLRYAWRAVEVFRHGAEPEPDHHMQLAEDMSEEYHEVDPK